MYVNWEETVRSALEKIADGEQPARAPTEFIIDRADEVLDRFLRTTYPSKEGQLN